MIAALVETGRVQPAAWLWVAGAALVPAAATTWLVAGGAAAGEGRLGPRTLALRAASSLRRLTGLPGWCAAGVALAWWALLVAGVGFYWDVAWHIDLGRDQELFTPPHALILGGLMGITTAGVASAWLATVEGAPVRCAIGRLRLPHGSVALAGLGVGGMIGFPLDDLWHAAYGIDVTMWGPTHLLMIGAATLTPFGMWLLAGQAGLGTGRRWVRRVLPGLLVGITALALAALQLEFDDGVPQWQALFQPVLIALAATLAATLARTAFGPGWALLSGIHFVAVRCVVALLVGPGLGHVVPRFPLTLGIALCVELGFVAARRRPAAIGALAAGALAGTAGLASEWGFSHLWGREPWQPSMLGGIWAAALASVAAAVLGTALGGVLRHRRAGIPAIAVAGAGVAAAATLLVPLPRSGADIAAQLRTSPSGVAVPVIDRFGNAGLEQPLRVEVTVPPGTEADRADWFWVISWQGGGREAVPLVEASPGRWVAPRSVPAGGSWKTILLLASGDVVVAAPVSMPADPGYGQSAIPAVPSRSESFVPASRLLMREAHGGAAWPGVVAYSALLAVVAGWLTLLVTGVVALSRGAAPRGRRRALRPSPSAAAALRAR